MDVTFYRGTMWDRFCVSNTYSHDAGGMWGVGLGLGGLQKSATPFLMDNFFQIMFHNLHVLLICGEHQLQFQIWLPQ
jgi:hypothetical protein